MAKRIAAVLMVLVLGVPITGCVVYAPPAPRHGAAWVPGHYTRYGRWVPGHWT